ncbi:UDP-N-acetylmuramate dehydrogenase [Pseudomonas duriflava]|uniref:UDP-N-acetylenolpyruvoylglucosamine reductase n=1 Tax=Pseudomonas duriflava TaxID=459528 RepID=A0A562Q9K8_9PSED|nr:UDP-N-acetylmuramate dehydrogenase [Pseudomonas duriflava]TWI53413.1 UDP-N-acetylmuramate dehydrogenase [Pseudomonas duriflava]
MSLVVQEQVSLKPLNTFGFDVTARFYAKASQDKDVCEALAFAKQHDVPLYVLGGGSNLVLTEDIDALVLHMASRGIRLLSESEDGAVIIEAEAGESWQTLVDATLALGLSGLENLSLIPGTVGASPIQNIGAYGVELKDVFAGLTALARESESLQEFSLEECAFAYRESRFKAEPGKWIVLRVRFRLSRNPNLRLDYGPIRQKLDEMGIIVPTPEAVSQAVSAIRREKLPDPAMLGNAGSFFKNPVVDKETARHLKLRYPDVVLYPQPDGRSKLAAGWLIDKAGWRGYRDGAIGVHDRQALVLVNRGGGTGHEVMQLAERIKIDIAQRFSVTLEMEPGTLT